MTYKDQWNETDFLRVEHLTEIKAELLEWGLKDETERRRMKSVIKALDGYMAYLKEND